jgi:hypothetical protein
MVNIFLTLKRNGQKIDIKINVFRGELSFSRVLKNVFGIE